MVYHHIFCPNIGAMLIANRQHINDLEYAPKELYGLLDVPFAEAAEIRCATHDAKRLDNANRLIALIHISNHNESDFGLLSK